MTLPAHMYGNPERILLAQEAGSCKGCVYRQWAWGVAYCQKHEKKAGDQLRRCKDYREGA